MPHPCSDGGPGIIMLGCTKFNGGCTKFCEGCTKGSKVGIDPKSFCYGFLNEIMAHPCSDGSAGSTSSDLPNFMKDLPNFVKNVPRVQKCVLKWGSTPNHFVMGL